MKCPICQKSETEVISHLSQTHPYVKCQTCSLWFNPRLPKKVYESSAELPGNQMSEFDRKVNQRLAYILVRNHVKKSKGTHLDIGSKYPYLGKCFKDQGFISYNVDGIDEILTYATELEVIGAQVDFENQALPFKEKFDIITLVHCLEHFYKPIQTLQKIASLLKDDGVLFIRCPSSDVEGIDRDLTKPHYEIHPYIYCETTVRYLLQHANLECYETYPLKPGQRDYLIRKIPNRDIQVINLARAGAIGDVLMTSTLIPGLKAKYPRAEINYYTRCTEAANLIKGVNKVYSSDEWDKRTPGQDYLLYGYPVAEGYPNRPMSRHLTEYFASEVGVDLGDYSLKEMTSLLPVKPPYITLHVKTGWSIYKEWDFKNWEEIVKQIHLNYPHYKIVQIGGRDEPLIKGVDIDYRGYTNLETSCALIRDANLHLGCDSFSNHVAGAYKTPAVILFGSTSPIGSGYNTAINIWRGLACSPCYKENPSISKQSQGPCSHHSCMTEITIPEVLAAIDLQILSHFEIQKSALSVIIRPTMCLGMIVKNEAHILTQCLDSIRSYIDYWVISDTGSTDGTQQLIRDYFKKYSIPGELVERPWVSFDINRSEVFQYAKGKSDYIWIIDADDKLVGTPQVTNLTAEGYYVKLKLGEIVYSRVQIFKNDGNWLYQGVVHEYPRYIGEGTPTIGSLSGEGYIEAGHEGARSKNPKKYLEDAQLLEAALKVNPKDTRSAFYLGQSYLSAGDYEQALKSYQSRVDLGGWDQEVFYSLYQQMECMYYLQKPLDEIIEVGLKAYHTRPTRAESLYRSLTYCRLRGRYYLGYMIGKFAQMIPYPSQDNLFVDKSIYEYKILDEFAVCAYWCSKFEECKAVCERLLYSGKVPQLQIGRIKANLDLSNQRLS